VGCLREEQRVEIDLGLQRCMPTCSYLRTTRFHKVKSSHVAERAFSNRRILKLDRRPPPSLGCGNSPLEPVEVVLLVAPLLVLDWLFWRLAFLLLLLLLLLPLLLLLLAARWFGASRLWCCGGDCLGFAAADARILACFILPSLTMNFSTYITALHQSKEGNVRLR